MSQRAIKPLEEPPGELIYSDGEPLDSNWHRIQMTFLIDVIRQAMAERGRADFFAGGDMFVYYSFAQARDIASEKPRMTHFRGPDVFFVAGVPGQLDRKAWVVWEEDGRYPNLIVELLSPSTARVDRTAKKELYASVFRTPEYFLYDPETEELEGFRLYEGAYQRLKPDARGWLWSRELDLWLGRWQGERAGFDTTWLRLYDRDGRLVPTPEEAERLRAEAERQRAEAERQRAEAERQRAEEERQRADAAEAEVARLRALLEQKQK
jgi:Uma2 family endonuclease